MIPLAKDPIYLVDTAQDLDFGLGPADPFVYPEAVARWEFSARDGQTVPHAIAAQLDAWRIKCLSTITPARETALAAYTAAIQADLEPFAKRRIAEQALASYIVSSVVPVALVHEADKLRAVGKALSTCRTFGEHAAVIKDRVAIERRVLWSEKCGLAKLCPDEARAEGQRIAEHYLPHVLAWRNAKPSKRRVFYAVLTQPNFPIGGLHEGKRSIFADWTKMLERLRHNKVLKKKVGHIHGALVVQEDPLSALGDWNIHLNVMLLVEGAFNYQEFRDQWGYNLEVKEVPSDQLERAFVEICKYQAKATSVGNEHAKTQQPGMVDWAPSAWLEWWRANTGFRRTRSYGVLFNVEDLTEEYDPENVGEGARLVKLGRMQWTGKSYRVEVYQSALLVDLILDHKSGLAPPGIKNKLRPGAGGIPPPRSKLPTLPNNGTTQTTSGP